MNVTSNNKLHFISNLRELLDMIKIEQSHDENRLQSKLLSLFSIFGLVFRRVQCVSSDSQPSPQVPYNHQVLQNRFTPWFTPSG